MEPKLNFRGLVAGGAAGVAAFVFARIFAEPLMGRAIAYQEGRTHAEAALYGGVTANTRPRS